MKFIFISSEIWSEFNPEGIVSRKIVKGFVDNSFAIEVITNKDFQLDIDSSLYKKTIINAPQLGILEKVLKFFFGLENLFFIIKTIIFLNKKIKVIEEYSDEELIVITRSEPISIHLINIFLRGTRIRKICMFSDVGCLNPYLSRFNFLKRLITFLIEKLVIKSADLITHTNKFAIEKYGECGFDISKYIVFPNPLQIEYQNNENNFLLLDIKPKNQDDLINLVYTGSLYGKRNPEYLFKYLMLQDNFKLYLVGAVRNIYYEGRFKIGQLLKKKDIVNLTKLIKKYDLDDRVSIIPFMPKKDLVEFIVNHADILVNIDARADVNLFLSSKVVDYTQYGKPILNISSPGATVEFLKSIDVTEYMDYYDNFKFSIYEIYKNDNFSPDVTKLYKYTSKNLVKNLILYLT